MTSIFAARLPLLGALSCSLVACVVQAPAPPRAYVGAPAVVYRPAPPADVVSIYIEPPLEQPMPVAVAWAPPPMLVEPPPPSPFGGAVWIGGYWAWHGNWVWAAGRWAPPPQPNFVWVQPYYEHRDAAVLFIGGHWAAPGVAFVPPPLGVRFSLAVTLAGVVPGPPPMGPPGIFVPPPPGSRPGLIVPAPLGTPPAVVVSAPPVTQVGMRVQGNVVNGNNSRVGNVSTSTTNNVTNITNVTNLTVTAPAAATANGRAYEASIPAQAHLAAALPPVVHAVAPTPQSSRPLPAYQAGQAPAPLPQPQAVRTADGTAAPPPLPQPQAVRTAAGTAAPPPLPQPQAVRTAAGTAAPPPLPPGARPAAASNDVPAGRPADQAAPAAARASPRAAERAAEPAPPSGPASASALAARPPAAVPRAGMAAAQTAPPKVAVDGPGQQPPAGKPAPKDGGHRGTPPGDEKARDKEAKGKPARKAAERAEAERR